MGEVDHFCCEKQMGGFKDGQVWFGSKHEGACAHFKTKCQYCGVVTGETGFRWATEDVCGSCNDDAAATVGPRQGG